jgi:hypothetical protein
MQARIETRRLPSAVVTLVFAILMALVIGVALGYAIKPAAVVSGPVHTIVVPIAQQNPTESNCLFVDKHKAC